MHNDRLENKGISGFRAVISIFAIAVLIGLLVFFLKDSGKISETPAPGHDIHQALPEEESKSEFEKEAEDFFDETPAKNSKQGTAPKTGTARKILFYRNPMNPAISSPVAAKDEMGMDYIPVYEDEAQEGTGTGISGMAPVVLEQQGIELSGVITAPAVTEMFVKTIRTVGQVTVDETRVHTVQTRVSGWVEELFVNYQGQMVEKGTPLLSIYSPELVSSQEEFIGALETLDKKQDNRTPEEKKYMKTIIDAARKRLQLFEVPKAVIEELEKTRKSQRLITLEAPVSGFATGKEIFNGQRLEPGMAVLTLTDFSRIWVEADFYEYEASELKPGQETVLFSPYNPDLQLKGKIAYIYPYLNTATRTLKARMEFFNEDLRLKPGMFVDILLNIDLGESLVIPESAVMYSGLRKIVFVNTAGGRFEPREVITGARSNSKIQILSGVMEEERIAIKANFLLDSESRLQAIIQNAAKAKSVLPDGGEND